MSALMPFSLKQLSYLSHAEPCSYLPGQTEQKRVTLLQQSNGAALYSQLVQHGFRRSQNMAYRPACTACDKCTPVRIPVAEFVFSDNQKKLLRRNSDLTMSIKPARANKEQFALFEAYQQARHGDGDMADMGYGDYVAMVNHGLAQTDLREWRDQDGVLKSVMLADKVGKGLSGVYSFFDPEMARKSLGTFMILSTIAHMQHTGGDYLYLGYYVSGSRKMEYKARFHPLQKLGASGWQTGPA